MAQPTRKNLTKRICFVLDSSHLAFDDPRQRTVGGSELQVRAISEKFVSLHYEIFIGSKETAHHKDIRFFTTDTLFSKLKGISPDVVIATIATKTALRAALACKLLGFPFVYRLAHDVESEFKTDRVSGGSLLERMLFTFMLKHLTTKIWCQHELQKKNLEKRGLGKKTFVFYNVFPLKKAVTEPLKKRTILWVGRFVRWKQPEVFVSLAQMLPKRKFIMISPGVPKEFKESCKTVKNLQLIDYVPFSKIDRYFAQARVFINTSRSEGFPNAFINATSEGTPIISMNINPDNLFERYDHGFLIADMGGMCNKINELFEDKEGYKKISRNAKRYALEVHDIERNIGALERHLLQ